MERAAGDTAVVVMMEALANPHLGTQATRRAGPRSWELGAWEHAFSKLMVSYLKGPPVVDLRSP